jgi:hypothetical protein
MAAVNYSAYLINLAMSCRERRIRKVNTVIVDDEVEFDYITFVADNPINNEHEELLPSNYEAITTELR